MQLDTGADLGVRVQLPSRFRASAANAEVRTAEVSRGPEGNPVRL